MNEPDDLDIARRLKAHYRETATAGVPVTLVSEVRAMFSSVDGRRRLRTGRLAAVIAAVFVVLVGTAFALGRPGIGPSSSGSTAQSSPAVGSQDPVGSTSSSVSASPIAPSPSAVELTDQVTVLRGAAIEAAIAAASDDAPFLIGGSLSYLLVDCFISADFPATPLLTACGGGLNIRDDGFQSPLAADMAASGLTFADGDIVVRVHTRDARAADCPANYRVRCERAIVVEQVVWRPDATGSGRIPPSISILPPQVDPRQCDELEFGYQRCTAVVERARSIIGIGWPDIRSVTLAGPTGGEDSAGSDAIANLVFQTLDGTDHDVQVRCLSFRSASVVCGPATVKVLPTSPAPVPTP